MSAAGCVPPEGAAELATSTSFSASKTFTFLFLTLGPFKIIGPFVLMTRGRDRDFKRRLALTSAGYAALGIIAAATVGVSTLESWSISVGALQLAASIVVFLVALREVMNQYAQEAPAPSGETQKSVRELAMPLAFPTIATPYGVAVVIMLAAIRSTHLVAIAALIVVVLALNVVAMLNADRVAGKPSLATLMSIVGMVMGVLLLALGIQAGVEALRLLEVV